MSQQYVTGQQWENTCSSTAVLSVVSEWVIGHWLCNKLCPWFWTHKLCPLVTRFLERHGKVTRGPSISPWCFHGGGMCVVQRGDNKWYCGRYRYGSSYTYIIQPQRASIFGEYTHVQLMPCLQSYTTIRASVGHSWFALRAPHNKCWPCTQQ